MIKRLLALGVGLIFVAGVAALSFADEASNLKAEIAKVKSQISAWQKKWKAAKGAQKISIAKQVKAAQARLQTLEARWTEWEASQGTSKMTKAPEPMSKTTSPAAAMKEAPKPAYAMPAGMMGYEAVAQIGYEANGFGVGGRIGFPNIFNDMAKSMGLAQAGMGNIGLTIGAGFISGKNNTTNVTAKYAPISINGVITLYTDPSYSLFIAGGPNFNIASGGRIGGQVAVGGDWTVPELGGKVFTEIGWSSQARTAVGRVSSVLVNAGYKFAF